MSAEPRLPDCLLRQRREREHEIDRSALCSCVNDEFQVNSECRICRGSGIRPPESDEDESTPDEIRALGYEPIPEGHPALENEQWSPTYGAWNRTRR